MPPITQPPQTSQTPQVSTKKYTMIASGAVVFIIILSVGYYFKITETKNVYPPPGLEKSSGITYNNSAKTPIIATTTMIDPTQDPIVQTLITQYKELVQKLQSSKTMPKDPSEEDLKIIDDLQLISNKLEAFDTKNGISSALNITKYGYEASLAINGHEVDVTGKGSTVTRLMYENSIMAQVATQEVKDGNFVLKHGENIVVLTYNKKEAKFPLTSSFYITPKGAEPKKVFDIQAEKKTSGVITIKFTLPLDENLKTIEVSE